MSLAEGCVRGEGGAGRGAGKGLVAGGAGNQAFTRWTRVNWQWESERAFTTFC